MRHANGITEPRPMRILRDRQGNRAPAKLSNFRVVEARRALLDEPDNEVETKIMEDRDGTTDEG